MSLLEKENIKIDNLEKLLKKMIDSFIKNHTISKKAHEELMAMSHLDEDVANIFKNSELELTNKIVSIIKNNNIKIKNPIEKIHIAIGIIENLCHELVYHKHKDLDYNVMQDEVVKIITNILKK